MSATPLMIQIVVDDDGSVKIRKLGQEAEKAGRQGETSFRKTGKSLDEMNSRAVTSTKHMVALAAAMASIYAAGRLAQGFLDTAKAFETMEVSLRTITGSAQNAKSAMAWITEFTAKTPYELNQVSEAFIRLEAQGLSARKNLGSLGDTAAAMGKSLLDSVDMFADAVRGENERLKEFGVVAKDMGNQVAYNWSQNGQNMTITADKNAESITNALMRIFQRFEGGMEEQSKTWTGMMSNMSDSWEMFKKQVMDAGVFDVIKNALRDVLSSVDRLKEEGKLKEWAEDAAAAIKLIADSIGFLAEGVDNVSRMWLSTKNAWLAVEEMALKIKLWANEGEASEKRIRMELIATQAAIVAVKDAMVALDAEYHKSAGIINDTQKAMDDAGGGTKHLGKGVKDLGSVAGLTTAEIKHLDDAVKKLQQTARAKEIAAAWKAQDLADWARAGSQAVEDMSRDFAKYMDSMKEEGRSFKDFMASLQEDSNVDTPLFESSIFGDGADQALQNMMESLEKLYKMYGKLAEREKEIAALRKEAASFEYEEERAQALEAVSKKEAEYADDAIQSQLGGYRQLFGTLKGLFEENSSARKVMHVLEMGFAVAEIAIQMQKALVTGVGAVLNQGNGDWYSAFARIAAMASIVASFLSVIGVSFGGGSSGGGVETESKPPSTVLGADDGTDSESIAHALEILQDQNDQQLWALWDIKKETQKLNQSIMSLIVALLQGAIPMSGTGDGWRTDPINIGTVLAGGEIPVRLPGGVPRDTDIRDLPQAPFDDLGPIGEDLKARLTEIFKDLGAVFLDLAEGLGVDTDKVRDYIIAASRLDLSGMSPSEQADAIEAWFAAIADQMAADLFGDIISQYQQLGEGMFETAVRLVAEKEAILMALTMTGNAFGGTAEEAVHLSQALIKLAGGLEDLLEDVETYFSEFMTESEQLAWLMDMLKKAFEDLDMEMPATRQAFKDLVNSLDLTTEEGQALYVMLMALAGATDAYYDALEAANERIIAAQRKLSGTTDQGAIDDITDRYNLDPGAITKDWFQLFLTRFLNATPDQITEYAAALGVTVDQLIADILALAEHFGLIPPSAEDAADAAKDAADAAKDAADAFDALAESIRNNIQTVQDMIDKQLHLSGGGSESSYYMSKMEEYKILAQEAVAAGDLTAAMEALATGSSYLQSWYSAAVAEAQAAAQEAADIQREELNEQRTILNEQLTVARAFGSLVDTIDNAIQSIKYSDLNVSLPYQKAASAESDYASLKAAALSSGDVSDYQKFVSFAQTYLQQQQNDLKSSEEYQTRYATVMADLETARGFAQSESYEEAILHALEQIDSDLADIVVEVDLTAINDAFATMTGFIEAMIAHINTLSFIINIDWANWDGEIATALSYLLTLANEYGWNHEITLKFIADMAKWAAQDVATAIDLMNEIADKSGGWDSEAVITFIANLNPNMFKTVADLATVAKWIANESGGWNTTATVTFLGTMPLDPFKTMADLATAAKWIANQSGGWNTSATIAFLKNVAANWSFENIDQILAAIGWVKAQAGSWTADATISFIAELLDRYNVPISAIDAWLTAMGITDTDVRRDVFIRLVYRMVSEGDMDIAEVADYAFVQAVAAAQLPPDSADRIELLEMIEALGKIFGKVRAYDTGVAIGAHSPLAAAAGWKNDLNAAGLGLESFFIDSGLDPNFYAEGGIVSSPTLGIVGEAGYPEAIIPMRDGVSIPVKWVNPTGAAPTEARPININMVVELDGEPLDIKIKSISARESDKIRVQAEHRNLGRRAMYK